MARVDPDGGEADLRVDGFLDVQALLDVLLSLLSEAAVQLAVGVVDLHLLDGLGHAAQHAELVQLFVRLALARMGRVDSEEHIDFQKQPTNNRSDEVRSDVLVKILRSELTDADGGQLAYGREEAEGVFLLAEPVLASLANPPHYLVHQQVRVEVVVEVNYLAGALHRVKLGAVGFIDRHVEALKLGHDLAREPQLLPVDELSLGRLQLHPRNLVVELFQLRALRILEEPQMGIGNQLVELNGDLLLLTPLVNQLLDGLLAGLLLLVGLETEVGANVVDELALHFLVGVQSFGAVVCARYGETRLRVQGLQGQASDGHLAPPLDLLLSSGPRLALHLCVRDGRLNLVNECPHGDAKRALVLCHN